METKDENLDSIDEDNDSEEYIKIEDDYDLDKTLDENYDELMRSIGTDRSESKSDKVDLKKIDDFIRSYLVKNEMYETLETFNTEFYTLISKGIIGTDSETKVPELYVENQKLQEKVEKLTNEQIRLGNIAKKSKDTWKKFRLERDTHRMHHRRVVQEKKKIYVEIKRLQNEIEKYTPELEEYSAKYEKANREKMMLTIQRDKIRSQNEAMEKSISGLTIKEQKSIKTKSTLVIKQQSQLPINPVKPKFNYKPINPSQITLYKTFKGHLNSISNISCHPKLNIIATSSDDCTFKLWSIPDGEFILSAEEHTDWVSGLSFNPNGSSMASSSGDRTIKIWDFQKNKCIETLTDHTMEVWDISYHYTGDFLLSGSQDKTVKLWDMNVMKCKDTFRGHTNGIMSVIFEPYGNTLCSSSADKTISLWDPLSGLCVQTFYGHTNSVNSISYNNNGDTIVSCDSDGVIKFWDVRMTAERHSLKATEYPINSVEFDLNGTAVAASCEDGKIRLFDLNNSYKMQILSGHENSVQKCRFDPKGKYLFSGGSDCTFKIWSL